MEAIANLFAVLMTIPVFIPFAAFVIVYFLFIWKQRSRREAATLAVNVTTFFLIMAVTTMHGLIKDKESASAIWWVILFFLFTGMAIGFLQYKIKGQVDPPKMIRAVWRLAFVFFSVAYFILFFTGIGYFLGQT